MTAKTITAIVAITFMAIAGYFLMRKKPITAEEAAQLEPGETGEPVITPEFTEEELEEELEEEPRTIYLPTEEELGALRISGDRIVNVVQQAPIVSRETREVDDGIVCRTDSGALVAVSLTSGKTTRIVGTSYKDGKITEVRTTADPKPMGRFGVYS